MNKERIALLNQINHQTIVVTPNNRLSQQLLRDMCHDKQLMCMEKPRCLSYTDLLHHLYQQLRQKTPKKNHPLLLSKWLTRQLWRNIINQTQTLPCNDGLLTAIISAWTTCKNWQVSTTHPAFHSLQQTAQFQRWYHAFENQLQQMNAITDHHIAEYLSRNIASLDTPKTLIWVCFDDYTPAQITLQKALQMNGFKQLHEELTRNTNISYQLEAPETDAEYQQLIQWLHHQRAHNKQEIGVVIPNLETEASKLSRLLARHFSSEEINISLGQSLSEYPLVAHALQWLQLDLSSISTHQLRLLLSSPYLIRAYHEHAHRAQFMQDTPLLREISIPFSLLKASLPNSIQSLTQALQRITDYPTTASIPEWISYFQQRLTVLGFPGDMGLDSISYQCLQRFQKLFDEFRECSILTNQISQHEALDIFFDLVNTTIFQPQKKHTPIQVLGLLEASGCTFDSLWVAHMTDQCLPQKGHLSAFIPVELQRELDMPHANASRELRFAKQIIQRLQYGSSECIFSYAVLEGDKRCMPSPLIADIPLMHYSSISQSENIINLVLYEEPYDVPMQSTEPLTGGTSLLANQAKCPFRAFAAHRLHAKGDHTSSEGLSAQERGQLIHGVLEKLWKTVQTQEILLHYPTDALNVLIKKIIQESLEPIAQNHPHSFPDLLQSIEIKRLTQLVHACLDWEKKRPTFIVEAVEHTSTIELAGLTFHVKMDRLDRLSSGKKWVVDYKSRIPEQKPWTQERPKEPQLLLYALLDEAIHGLLFIELRHGQITCCGLSEESTNLQGIKPISPETSWENHHTRWLEQLTTLALEFKEGHCVPDPSHTTTCNQCDFQNLCRT